MFFFWTIKIAFCAENGIETKLKLLFTLYGYHYIHVLWVHITQNANNEEHTVCMLNMSIQVGFYYNKSFATIPLSVLSFDIIHFLHPTEKWIEQHSHILLNLFL